MFFRTPTAYQNGIYRPTERGNIFLAIFGAVALVGVLGASVMTFMKGPLATSVRLTKMNTAENQMAIGAQVAVMASANQAGGGDCDTDGTVEPVPFRDAGALPKPTGGGLVPLEVGISKKDPWGTEYGYCVWNHGSATSGGTCNANMLTGLDTGGYTAYPVVALVSAGPDKTFTTTCRTFTAADTNADDDLLDAGDLPLVSKAAETDDDVITTFTYEEATGASGGLWSIKSGSPGTAVIGKNIETTGVANFKGGLLLPDKALITCDASTAGVMAMNGSAIEICDGTAWEAITGGAAATGGLSLTPVTSSGMDVTGGCGNPTCYSGNVTFTLTNTLSPAAASVVLTTTLSNTTNFEFVSNDCNGQSLAAGDSCLMVVRAKTSGNISYTGMLQVTGENSPFAILNGTGSGFPGCSIGAAAPGGLYAACAVSGSYNLVITPSGCTATTTNPLCGGNDIVGMTAASIITGTLKSTCCSNTGLQNTINQVAYTGGGYTFGAAAWCASLQYGGFDDWFLPSSTEIASYFTPNRVTLGYTGNDASYYWSSTGSAGANNWMNAVVIGTGAISADSASYYSRAIRCMRRDPPAVMPSPVVDNTPLDVTFNPSYGGPSETRTSNTVSIVEITNPAAISISGTGSPEYSVDGGAYTSAGGTVNMGGTVTLRATSPTAGLERVISLTLGTNTYNWQVRTPGNNTIRVFTTNATIPGGGNIGGVGGGDAACTSSANTAGLTGSWVAVLMGTNNISVSSRLPWNWNQLRNMNGQIVATSLTDFMDGSVSAPMNFSETGAVAGSSIIWTGMGTNGLGGSNSCVSWTVPGAGPSGARGDSSQTGAGAYFSNGTNQSCNSANNRILCMESNATGSDVDPNAVGITPQVVFVASAVGTSNTITVTGVTEAVNVSIVPSAGAANIIRNGSSVGATTTTAGLNETLAFTLEAPAVLGTRNTATITIGTDTYNWFVGYGDSAKEARVFLAADTGVLGAKGGVAGADTICNNAALSSSLGLSANWKAILSDSSTDAFNRIPWNWGILKTVTGTTVVDGGFGDLWDGTLDSPINLNQNGGAPSNLYAHTGTDLSGARFYTGNQTTSAYWCTDWAASSGTIYAMRGLTTATGSNWIANDGAGYCGSAYNLYCIEDVSAALDITPNIFYPAYAIQVPTPSRQTSSAVLISGLSSGATTTLSVSATGGDPKFKVNGGAEVASALVTNGDSVVFLMDAPASGNSSNKMTITAGTMTTYWRVWTGDTTGSVTKRVFVSSINTSGNQGGVAGVDAHCQTKATAAGLGGTWKAIISGEGTDENQYAVNRIGYNWSTLERIDGNDVVLAGNIWNTATTPLLNPISINETGATVSTSDVQTGTSVDGMAVVKGSDGQCLGFSTTGTTGAAYYLYNGTSGVTSSNWIANGSVSSPSGSFCSAVSGIAHLYCIEQ